MKKSIYLLSQFIERIVFYLQGNKKRDETTSEITCSNCTTGCTPNTCKHDINNVNILRSTDDVSNII